MEGDGARGQVQDGIGGARVTVTGLAHAAGVDDQPLLCQCDGFPVLRPVQHRGLVGGGLHGQHRYVGVSHQAVAGLLPCQVGLSRLWPQDVLPDRVAQAAVHERELVLKPHQR